MIHENQKTILLVEDEILTAMNGKKDLEKRGYTVITANTGEKAMEIFRENNSVDLILMDINLGGGIDGTETAVTMSKEKAIPIVFLADPAKPEMAEIAEKITPCGCVEKNSEIAALDASIKMALKLYEAHKKVNAQSARATAIIQAFPDLSLVTDHTGCCREDARTSTAPVGIGERMNELLGRITDSVISLDTEWRYVYCNDAALKLIRQPRGNVIGRRIWDVFPDYAGTVFWEKYHEAMRTQVPVAFDNYYAPYDVWTAVRAFPSMEGLTIIALDITGRKRAEEARRVSEIKYRQLFHHAPAGIYEVDFIRQRFTRVNSVICEYSGYTEDELLSMNPLDILTDESKRHFLARLEKIMAGKPVPTNPEFCIKEKDGRTRWVEINVEFQRQAGRITGAAVVAHDITERKRAEEAIRIQHELSLALNSSMDLHQGLESVLKSALRFEGVDCGGIYLADPAGGALDLVVHQGLSPEFVARVSHYPLDSPNGKMAMSGEARYGNYSDFRPVFDEINGAEDLLSLASIPIMDKGRLIAVLNLASHTRDTIPAGTRISLETLALQISSAVMRLRTDGALRESEERYRTMFESTGTSMALIDEDMTMSMVNNEFVRRSGYSRDEIIGNMRWTALVHPDDLGHMIGQHRLRRENREDALSSYEFRFITKAGDLRDALFTITMLPGTRKSIASIIDITDRTLAENKLKATLRQMHDIIEFLPDPTFVIDQDRKVFAWNKAMEQLSGMKKEEILGQGDYAYALPFYRERRPILIDLVYLQTAELEARYEYVRHVENVVYAETYVSHMNDNTGAYLWGAAAPLIDSTGRKIGAIEVIRDITGRKRAQDAMEAALREKVLLLKEVHHRVKNNMQVIVSLLGLQTPHISNARDRELVMDIENSVRSMALVHEKLYRSENFSEINMQEYVRDLLFYLFQCHAGISERVEPYIQVGEILLNIDEAIPCGLLINELLSNAFKYAFPHGRKGTISVRLQKEESSRVLCVSDDGVGIPEHVNPANPETLGLRLISALTRQLGGTMEISRTGGTAFTIRF